MTGTTARKKLAVLLGLLLFILATYRFSSINYDERPTTIIHQDTTALLKAVLHPVNSSRNGASKASIFIHSNIKPNHKKRLSKAITDYDHFAGWPSPFRKSGCFKDYDLRDRTVSIILYMRTVLDSLPIQTFLSVIQFSSQSNINVKEVIVAYINDSTYHEAQKLYLTEITRLAGDSIRIVSATANTKWTAKLAAVELATSEQVFVVEDTIIMNRDFLPPLLRTLRENPTSVITPHIDSFMPMRLYTIYEDKQTHPDAQIWQETSFATYHVKPDMTMERQDHKKIHTIPPTIPSGGLNGEVMVASKTHLSFLLSRMKTDETAELSILTYLCGSGVIGNKCSVGVKSNAYDLFTPITKYPEILQRLYPFYDTDPRSKHDSACKNVKEYFTAIHRLVSEKGKVG